jgi:predicted ATPase
MHHSGEAATALNEPRCDLHPVAIVADSYDARTASRLSRQQIVAAAYDFVSHHLRSMLFHSVVADPRDHVKSFALDRVDHDFGVAARAENENLLGFTHPKW